MVSAPIQVPVCLVALSGSRAGERCYRLAHTIVLPPALEFSHPLPVEFDGELKLAFTLPNNDLIESRAIVSHTEKDSIEDTGQAIWRAVLSDLSETQLESLERYIIERTCGRERVGR